MFRRITLIVAVGLFFAFASTGAVRLRAQVQAMATVTPDSGTLRTTFTFSVSGLTPGHALDITLYDAVGNRYTYQKEGVDQSIVVDANGEAALAVTPATDLTGPAAGPWRAVFAEEETGMTSTIPFDVSP